MSGVDRPVGLTRNAGWQIGARRTLPVSAHDAWLYLTSPEGVALWLGHVQGLRFRKGEQYETAGGATGEVRVFVPFSHLRLTWRPHDWPRPSTIQLRLNPRGDRCEVAFHEEHLPGAAEREERRTHFTAVLDELSRLYAS